MKSDVSSLEWSRPARVAMVISFVAGLFLPGLATLFNFSPAGLLNEKRAKAAFPPLRHPDRVLFEKAYNDRFGFRDALVYGHNWVSIFIFDVSPTRSAILGKEGWLYYRRSIDNYRGLVDFSESEIERWRSNFAAKAAFFEKHHVEYLVVIAPNKESIYPEFLPDQIQKVRERTRLDLLLKAFGEHPPCALLYLQEPMLARKNAANERLFCKTDTHWNQLGALFAANEIVGRLRSRLPDLPPASPGDYEKAPETRPGGDLAVMIGLPNFFPEEGLALISRKRAPSIVPNAPWVAESKMLERNFSTFASDAPGRRRHSILCADSFGHAIAPLLAAKFERLVYIQHMPATRIYHAELPKMIELEHPDAVIELFTERNLDLAPEGLFSEGRDSTP
jgi:alginate O-acetyltransferase complex protein AlgJ